MYIEENRGWRTSTLLLDKARNEQELQAVNYITGG